jgi:hypothetical protein
MEEKLMPAEEKIKQWIEKGKEWIDLFLSDKDARLQAATELGIIGKCLHREYPSLTWGDLEESARIIFPPETLSPFLTEALAENNVLVQCEAILAVGELGGGTAAQELIGYMRQRMPTDAALYKEIVHALGKIGGTEIAKFLEEQPSSDKDAAKAYMALTRRHKNHSGFKSEFEKKPGLALKGSDPEAALASRARRKVQSYQTGTDEYVRWLVDQVL